MFTHLCTCHISTSNVYRRTCGNNVHNFYKSFCMDTMYVQLGGQVVTTITTTALQGIFQPYAFVELHIVIN